MTTEQPAEEAARRYISEHFQPDGVDAFIAGWNARAMTATPSSEARAEADRRYPREIPYMLLGGDHDECTGVDEAREGGQRVSHLKVVARRAAVLTGC